jgi:hypothetical protein
MYVHWFGNRWQWAGGVAGVLQDVQPLLDGRVGRVQIRRSGVRVYSIGDLVVARLVQTSEVVPHFRDIRVESDRTRVSVERIPVLVDLVVQHTDRAPECGVAAISVDCLLISLVGLVVPLPSHERSAEQVPALSVAAICIAVSIVSDPRLSAGSLRHTRFQTLCQVRHCLVLVGERSARLVMQPAELLEDLRVVGLVGKNSHVGISSVLVLFSQLAELPWTTPASSNSHRGLVRRHDPAGTRYPTR